MELAPCTFTPNKPNLNNQNRVNIFDSKKIISTLKSTPVKTDTVINNKNNNTTTTGKNNTRAVSRRSSKSSVSSIASFVPTLSKDSRTASITSYTAPQLQQQQEIWDNVVQQVNNELQEIKQNQNERNNAIISHRGIGTL